MGRVWTIKGHYSDSQLTDIAVELAGTTSKAPVPDRSHHGATEETAIACPASASRPGKRPRIATEQLSGTGDPAFLLHRLEPTLGGVRAAAAASLVVEIDQVLNGPGKLVRVNLPPLTRARAIFAIKQTSRLKITHRYTRGCVFCLQVGVRGSALLSREGQRVAGEL